MREEEKDIIFHNEDSYKEFGKQLLAHSILYVMASLGWGKSSYVKQYLDGYYKKSYQWINWEEGTPKEKVIAEIAPRVSLVVIDDFEHMISEDTSADFMLFLKNRIANTKFILLSSSRPPEGMLRLVASNDIYIWNNLKLRLSQVEAAAFFERGGCSLYDLEIRKIERDFSNQPIAMLFLVHRIRELGGRYNDKVRFACTEDLLNYIDVQFFRGIELTYQDYLLQLAYFNEVTPELVAYLFEVDLEQAQKGLVRACRLGSIFDLAVVKDCYVFEPMFALYLKRYVGKYIPLSKSEQIFRRAITYYKEKGQYDKAIEFASVLEDEEQMIALLELILPGHVSTMDYLKLDVYMKRLPRNVIMSHPKFIVQQAMAAGITMKIDEAWEWYRYLEEFAAATDDTEQGKEIKQMMFYLRISMPNGNPISFLDSFAEMATQYKSLRMNALQDIVITSYLPSAINGGKDFSAYAQKGTRTCQLLAKSLSVVAPFILGKKVKGYAELVLGEMEYEKNNLSAAMRYTVKGLMEAKSNQNTELIFAGVAAMIHIMIANEQGNMVLDYWDQEEPFFAAEQGDLLYKNRTAFIIEYEMRRNRYRQIQQWLTEEAPDEQDQFVTLYRYQFYVKLKAYILEEEYFKAQYLLHMLTSYAQSYDRTYLMLQLNVMSALLAFRQGEEDWKEYMELALKKARELGFVRVIADEGAAVLPMLEKLSLEKAYSKNAYFKEVRNECRKMAEKFPNYLKKPVMFDKLTALELEVLKLVERGNKNLAIAKTLCVSENTVKYHLKNIYVKLSAKSRVEAVALAKEHKML